MLAQRRRRWANISPALVQHLVMAKKYRLTYPANEVYLMLVGEPQHF